MQLNGEQRKTFHESLLSAFPSTPKLRQMVSFELNKNLDAIATGENHSDIVFELIRWAETKGKVKDLLHGARFSNPGNLELQSFEEKICSKPNSHSHTPVSVNSLDWGISQQKPYLKNANQLKIEEDVLSSDRGIDYKRLQDLLKAGKWKEADQETLKVMLKAADREKEFWLDSDSIENFPGKDLCSIDRLWVKYSHGHFGFSVQKRIWEGVGRNYKNLGVSVGWRRGMWLDKKWLNYNESTFLQDSPQAYLPLGIWMGRGWELWDGWFDSYKNGLFLLSRQDL